MALRGAIFDCDGTLLDSMPMWSSMCVRLLEHYGVSDAQRVFEEHESLDMDKKCFWYHEHLGIGESGEQLYRELWTMVEEAYRQEVRPFDGCREFLEDLAKRGIPMVIASSTPTALLEAALAAHGLLGYFDRLVFAGDVGRGKEYPDVYLAARELLGTDKSDTWVFEDAPFGIRSAARAGFPVVALMNDHDGRDEAFVLTWATKVSWGYGGLDAAEIDAMAPRVMRALVVGGSPQPSEASLVASLAAQSDFVIAVDKGAETLMRAHTVPDILCGDGDSISTEALAWVERAGSRWERHPIEKDDTDLGLAIACAQREADSRGMALEVRLTCVSGGRPDHALGVWGVVARHADLAPRVVEDAFECRVLSPAGTATWRLCAPASTTLSAVSLDPDTVASERGTHWELDHAHLRLLDDLGVSNRVVGPQCTITCHCGVLAVFVLR